MIPNGKVKTLSTTAMINDLVKQIGGEFVDSEILIKGELDPHSYQLVKGDDEKLAFSDLIFSNGLGLEHGPSLQNYLLNNHKSLPVGNRLMEDHPELILSYQGQLDPHIWMDISLWARTIPYIIEALSNKDPTHSQHYQDNGSKLLKQMTEIDQQIKNDFHQLPPEKRYLVTSHDAFQYFTRAYLAEPNEFNQGWEKRSAAPEGLAPDSQISTHDIQSIINYLQQHQVNTIFAESNVNRDSIRKIAQAAKEKGTIVKIPNITLYADAMGAPGSNGDTYLKMIRHNATVIINHLSEKND